MSLGPFRRMLVITILGLLLLIPAAGHAQQEPVVHAVLFYSPTCPHCRNVINEVLLPMVDQHGERLQIAAVDVTTAGGQELYQSAVAHFEIPDGRLGVPTLIVGDIVLVGDSEIPAQFPDIVQQGLVTGIDWPDIPGFVPPAGAGEQATVTATSSASATPLATATPLAPFTLTTTITAQPALPEQATSALAMGQPTSQNIPTTGVQPPAPEEAPLVLDAAQPEIAFEDPENPPADPVGFALAAAVLVAMIIACAYVAWCLIIPLAAGRAITSMATAPGLSWAIPLIAVLGIGVAAYLAYVEVNQVTAVCGPVGHCNLVQSSAYARILGIPVAMLGIASYATALFLWFVQRLVPQGLAKAAAQLGLIALTVFGTLFSIYLTLVELFAIRAVCAWCLSSAVFTTLLMLLAARPATREPEPAIT
jgi:thiol-disulfide isomerase/thioredoxin